MLHASQTQANTVQRVEHENKSAMNSKWLVPLGRSLAPEVDETGLLTHLSNFRASPLAFQETQRSVF